MFITKILHTLKYFDKKIYSYFDDKANFDLTSV